MIRTLYTFVTFKGLPRLSLVQIVVFCYGPKMTSASDCINCENFLSQWVCVRFWTDLTALSVFLMTDLMCFSILVESVLTGAKYSSRVSLS